MMTSAPVVSNSSPLIALGQIGYLYLLEQLFTIVLIPPGVAYEVAPTVILPIWTKQQNLTQAIGPLILRASLGKGESEAISLAVEIQARLLILDDRPARRLAQSLFLPVIGTLGVLLAAKQKGLLPEIRPCLDALLQQDFRIAPKLYNQLLSDAHESP